MFGYILHRPNLKRAVLLIGALSSGLAAPSDAQTISPRRLLEIVDLGNPAISPDGKLVAFRTEQASVERNTYDTVWYVQRVDQMAPPRRIADGGVPIRQANTGLSIPVPATWSPDGRWIYFRAFIDGKVAVWRAAADGSGAQAVTTDAADVRSFSLSEDGQILKYSVGATRDEVWDAEKGEYDRGIHIDNTAFVAGGLFRSSAVEGRLATQHFKSGWWNIGPLLSEVADRWKAVNLSSMTTSDLPALKTPAPQPTASDLSSNGLEITQIASNSHDGRIAVLTPSANADSRSYNPNSDLALLSNGENRALLKCPSALCNVKRIIGLRWRPHRDEILFTVQDGHDGRAQSIFRWNVATGNVRPVVRTSGLISGSERYWDVPCGVSTATLVCVVAEASSPPRLEAIDIDTGRRRILFAPNLALASDIKRVAPAKLIRWTDARGREFTGQLLEARRKKGAKPPPLFVTYYTCDGFLRGGLGDEWPLTSLAEAGVTALCINRIPQINDAVENSNAPLLAVESIVRILSSQGMINATRIGMGGLSYGSEVTLWTVMHSNIITAASITSPSITPIYYHINSLRDGFREGLKKQWGLGAPNETPQRWREISPVFNLDEIRAPILFQMPEQEYIDALEYVMPLIRTGRGDMFVFPNEPHIKFQPRHKLAAYQRNLDWFRFWLQDYEDPDPLKVDQYRRWREMRAVSSIAASGSPNGLR